MLQRGRSTSVHPLIALFAGLALTACSDTAHSQGEGAASDKPSQAASAPSEVAGPPHGGLEIALGAYSTLEYCEVDSGRLQAYKQKMKDTVTKKLQRMTPAQFDAAFDAGLPAAREAAAAAAAANPAETEKNCEAEREWDGP